MPEGQTKSAIRKHLREVLAHMSEADRHAKSLAACSLITASPEFTAARCIMLYLSSTLEVDTASLALRGTTCCVRGCAG